MLAADTQAKMYNRLTPLYRDIGAAQVTASTDGTGYFKSAALLKVDDPSLITDDTITGTANGTAVSVRIRRDNYGVPHIFSDTDAGVTFGAGYVTAADRSLLLNQARYNGIASLADLPGVSGINLVLGLYDYQPSKSVTAAVTKQQTDALNAAGAQGKQVLRDIDIYLAGINKWYTANQPSAKPFTRTDVFAANGIKAQFLGEGGGEEISNALFLDAARTTLGTTNGNEAYTNMRGRYDPETMVTTTNKFDYQTDVSVSNPKGLVRLKNGSFTNSYVTLPGATASSSAVKPPGPGRQEASNIMLAAGSKTTTGKPLMVGGPQIGYNYPGLTMEMGLYGPSINVRGATSAPFPGYMLIGRAANYAWSLTSAGNDIVDTYAETLCGGSKYKYEFKGKCKSMEKVNGGTISRGGKTTNVVFYRTVHGSVYGYAKSPGSSKLIALAKRRSSYGRESTDLLFAIDSIPAVLGILPVQMPIEEKRFIAFTSNIFAIMGLRSMYFAISGFMHLFRFLKPALSFILVFIGVKMILPWAATVGEPEGQFAGWAQALVHDGRVHIPTSVSLSIIGFVLALAIALSVAFPKKK